MTAFAPKLFVLHCAPPRPATRSRLPAPFYTYLYIRTVLFFDRTFLWKRKVGTILFFEKKSRQKKLRLSGSLCGVLI